MEHINFVILSDSLSAINSILDKSNPSDITVLIQNKHNEVKTEKKQIVIIWISEHTSIKGNETACKYAKLAVSNTETTVLDLIPYDGFKHIAKTHIREKWHIF